MSTDCCGTWDTLITLSELPISTLAKKRREMAQGRFLTFLLRILKDYPSYPLEATDELISQNEISLDPERLLSEEQKMALAAPPIIPDSLGLETGIYLLTPLLEVSSRDLFTF